MEAVSSVVDGLVHAVEGLNEEEDGKRVTILSIDGGGVRGVVPVRILELLEEQLQEWDGPDARICDYFDVIAGTSAGALIGGLLTLPDKVVEDDNEGSTIGGSESRPRFAAADAMQLYGRYGRQIFTQRTSFPIISNLLGPKYSSEGLERLLLEKAKDTTMRETLTELLIPTFDIKEMQPIYFSTFEAKCDPLKNATIRDVLRGTSAAPTYFPPALFHTSDGRSKGARREFNLVDGGVFMNNPTHHAIVHAQKLAFKKSCEKKQQLMGRVVENLDYRHLMVLSLGTGMVAESYSSTQAATWGVWSWVVNNGKSPLIDISFAGSADVVDYNLSTVFQTFQCPENYLRIQAPNLTGRITAIDNVTPDNIKELRQVADKLLESTVTVVDLDTGKYVPQEHRGTNKEALKRFAKRLVQERKARCSISKT